MTNILVNLRPHFTDADKEACKPVIAKMLELAEIARTRGLMALEFETELEENLFLKMAMRFVANALGPEDIKQILQHSILAGDYSGAELLSRLVIIEGTLSIQFGDPPYKTQNKLGAMLGEAYCAELLAAHPDSSSEALMTERLLCDMHHASIREVLIEIDNDNLVILMHGCGENLIRKILKNLPANRGDKIWEAYCNGRDTTFVSLKNVKAALEKVMKKIDYLEKSGEISLQSSIGN